MVAMQIRPYAPVESRSIMWISYGSGAFTTSAPFYANVDDTPAYLRDTTPEVSTGLPVLDEPPDCNARRRALL